MTYRFIILLFIFTIGFSNSAISSNETNTSQLEIRNKEILKRKKIITTEPDEIIELMQNKFKSFNTYSAKFKEFRYGSLRNGEMYYKKPYSMRINYLNSSDNSSIEIYINKRKLFVYLKALNLVAEQDLLIEKEEISGDKQILDVVNLNNLTKSYNFNFLESKSPVNIIKPREATAFRIRLKSEVKGYHFLLTPKDKTRGLSDMELWVSPKGYVIRAKSWTIENKLIDFLFYNINLDNEISDDVFEFVVPPSAQISENLFVQFDDSE